MHSSEQSRAVRWFVIVVLSLATAAMFAVSMRANYLYGYGIGQTPETQLAIAWANVAADVWKGFGLIVLAALWRSRFRRAATVVCLTWAACLSFSVSSAIGIYVQERTALTGGREAKHASYEDTRQELADLEEKLRGLGRTRPTGQIEATIGAVLARPVGSRGTVGSVSANCSKTDARTVGDCAEVARLSTELAGAVEVARLESRKTFLRERIEVLRERGAATPPDPVAQFWTWMTRGLLTIKDVGFGLPLFFACMIEMVSAFGPVGIAAYVEATRATTSGGASRHVAAGRDTPSKVAPGLNSEVGEKEVGRLVQYMADRTEPTKSPAGLGADELYADYDVWCVSSGMLVLSQEDFLNELDRVRASPQLQGRIKKFGSRYFGIALIDRKAPALPAQ